MKKLHLSALILALGALGCVFPVRAQTSSSNTPTEAWIPWGDSGCVSTGE